MTRSELLDARRNIRKELVAFISIVMIALLATLAFLGISYSAAALKQDALLFFNGHELWDVEVTSTMLMTDEDLTAIQAVPGVSEAERVWQIDTRLSFGEKTSAVSIVSLPETISVPILLEGRLPENAKECAVERNLAEEYNLSVGQHLPVKCDPIMNVDPLTESDFVITGIFHTPDHFSYMVPVTPYIFVQADAFNRDGFGGAFMKARIRIAGAPENRYSEEYWDVVNPVISALEELSGARTAARVDGIRAGFEKDIHAGEEKIESAREQLRQAQQKIDDGWQELAGFEASLEPVPGMLDAGAAKLNQGEMKLEEALERLEKMGIHLSEQGGLLDRLEETRVLLDHANLFFERMISDDGVSQEAVDIFRANAGRFENMTTQQALAEIQAMSGGTLDLSEAIGQLRTLRDGIDEYERGRLDYYYSGEQYLDALTMLDNGRKKLLEGEKELLEGKQKLSDAELELASAREQLNDIGTCRWILLNNNGNPGFIYAAANADKLSSLSMSFSAIFLVVGALVIYATISRMVEQQRKQIGVNKAMGLFNREIFGKYLIFACSAVILGSGLGVLLAWLPMQRAVLSSYEAHLNYGTGPRSFLPLDTGLVIAGAIAIASLAVYLGCAQLLRQTALALIQGAASIRSKKKKAHPPAKRSLYMRLILRNMKTDWNRVLVTIVSIAGGCVLMVVGFTLRYGISGVPARQFGGIMTYDAEVIYDAGINADVVSDVEAILDSNGLPHVNLHKQDTVYEVNEALNALTLVVAKPGDLDGYHTLHSILRGKSVSLPGSGALVPRRFSEYYGVAPGDAVTVFDTAMNRRTLRIADVFENYYGQVFFLSPQSYEEIFGTAPVNNCFFVKTNGMSLDELQKKLGNIPGVVSVNDAAAARTMIEQFTSGLNFVVYLMLFIAAMMSCFIVANFTMTFIQRKTSELTIMRINGFTSGECIRYVAVDLIVTTILGTAVGLVVGGLMGQRILRVTETPYIQMIREPRLESFLYAALFTLVFSLLTNGYALRRIRKLKLNDISS